MLQLIPYIPACMHTHIHTYIHTYIHILHILALFNLCRRQLQDKIWEWPGNEAIYIHYIHFTGLNFRIFRGRVESAKI